MPKGKKDYSNGCLESDDPFGLLGSIEETTDGDNKLLIRLDMSQAAYDIRDYYSRRELCRLCKEEGTVCPYDHDTIRCVYSDDMEEM